MSVQVIRFALGLKPVLKHAQHDQKTHGNWATGNVGNFTLDASSDPMGLTTYNHPNGSRVIFQGIDNYYDNDGNPTPEKKEKIEQALEIIDSLQKEYPLENLTVAFENDPDGENVVVYPILGQAINIQRSAMNREELEGNARPVGLLSKDLPNGKKAGSYIVINSQILGNDPSGVPYNFKTFAEANLGTADPKHLIRNDLPLMLSTITHEYGHALDNRSESDAKFAWNMMDDSSTSNYGRTNSREYFAETFTAWQLDRNNPKWQKSFNWLSMDKVGTKVNKSVGSKILFIVKDRFDGGEPFLQEFGEVLKHEGGGHDQSSHGNWATGSVPTSIITSTNAIGQETQTITYGDIVIERDKPTGVRDLSDLTRYMWTFTAGSDAMRTVSSQIMRTPNPSNQMQLNDDTKNTILEGVEHPNPSTSDNFATGNYARQYISGAYTLLEDVRTSEPLSEPLFRGLVVSNSSSLLQLKVGETFALPLSSVTNSQNVAERYSWRFGSNRIAQSSIVFKLENTRATAIRHQSSEGGNRLVSEYVTQGKYKVESISRGTDVKGDDYTLVTLSQTDVFNIEKGNYESTTP